MTVTDTVWVGIDRGVMLNVLSQLDTEAGLDEGTRNAIRTYFAAAVQAVARTPISDEELGRKVLDLVLHQPTEPGAGELGAWIRRILEGEG